MKHLILFELFIVMLGAATLVQAQEKSDTLLPNEETKVTREYDEQGNLIRFDSVYVKSWASDTILNNSDMENFRNELDALFGYRFGSFFSDSTLTGANPFGDPDRSFPFPGRGLFDPFDAPAPDSLFFFSPDSLVFPFDINQLRQEMMDHFRQFFLEDSSAFQWEEIPRDGSNKLF